MLWRSSVAQKASYEFPVLNDTCTDLCYCQPVTQHWHFQCYSNYKIQTNDYISKVLKWLWSDNSNAHIGWFPTAFKYPTLFPRNQTCLHLPFRQILNSPIAYFRCFWPFIVALLPIRELLWALTVKVYPYT